MKMLIAGLLVTLSLGAFADCKEEAAKVAMAVAKLKYIDPDTVLTVGTVNKISSKVDAVYEVDIEDTFKSDPNIWPGHNIYEVHFKSEACDFKSIELVESFI